MGASAPPPQANPPVRGSRRPAPAGPLGFVWSSVVMGWRWLTRMRTALYLLGALALMSVIGTLVPQEPNVPSTVLEWREGESGPGVLVSQLLDAFGAFDVYGSPLFNALLLLLYLSLTACLIPRIRAWIRLVRRSQPPLIRHLGRQDASAELVTDATPDQVHATATQLLRRRRWRVRTGPIDPSATAGDAASAATPAHARKPDQVAAEKGLVSREGGSLLFHLSFYVLLGAIVFGQLMTFEGQRGVVEGEPGFRDTAVSYWSYAPGRWFGEGDHAGWRLDLDEFHVDWVRDPMAAGAGQPTEFRSEVTITPEEGEPYEATIDSNRPIDVEGMQVTQLDWGYAPRVVVEVDGEVVHDGFITPQVEDGGAYRGAVKAPAADPDVGLEIFLYPFAPDDDETGRPIPTGAPWDDAPMLLFRQWRGDLQLGATQQTLNELDTSALESEGGAYLRLGQRIEVGDVTIAFPELRRWAGLQVSSRPAIPALLGGAVLLVVGLVASLYAYRRRLWVLARHDEETGRTVVTVAGRAFQRPEAFEVEHAELFEELSTAVEHDHRPGEGTPPGRQPGPPDPTDTPHPNTPDDHEVVRP
jgi:cytochrome c biogenesis protein